MLTLFLISFAGAFQPIEIEGCTDYTSLPIGKNQKNISPENPLCLKFKGGIYFYTEENIKMTGKSQNGSLLNGENVIGATCQGKNEDFSYWCQVKLTSTKALDLDIYSFEFDHYVQTNKKSGVTMKYDRNTVLVTQNNYVNTIFLKNKGRPKEKEFKNLKYLMINPNRIRIDYNDISGSNCEALWDPIIGAPFEMVTALIKPNEMKEETYEFGLKAKMKIIASNSEKKTLEKAFLLKTYTVYTKDVEEFVYVEEEEPEEDKGLSGSKIAGIVIGAIVVVAIIGFCVYWFVCRNKGESEPDV